MLRRWKSRRFGRVNWGNESRLHRSLGYRTPVDVEGVLWQQDESREIMAIQVNA